MHGQYEVQDLPASAVMLLCERTYARCQAAGHWDQYTGVLAPSNSYRMPVMMKFQSIYFLDSAAQKEKERRLVVLGVRKSERLEFEFVNWILKSEKIHFV